MTQPFGIHWFRRDLRVAGNNALQWNLKKTQGRTLGIFFFDSGFLARPDFSSNRFAFFLQSLKALREELQDLGGDLLVLDSQPDAGFDLIFSKLKSVRPTCVTFNRDYEPFARQRDTRIIEKLLKSQIEVNTERDHLVIEPSEVQKDGTGTSFYQVYTPFFKKWYAALSEKDIHMRLTEQNMALQYLEKRKAGKENEAVFRIQWKDLIAKTQLPDALNSFIETNSRQVTIPIPKAGSLAAYSALLEFESKLDQYDNQRDFPAQAGTSKLSMYFKNGSITPALVLRKLGYGKDTRETSAGRLQFLKEIAWREFYYHILYHCPEVETQAFLPRYRNLSWSNNADHFEAWKEGKTGYPIVDAGMRELKTTGWMHNRVRMIVASFLTKDLLIDWRWGEKYFMNQLLDGDLAPNNGGWQWAASTGCDPQPYFRIFNPKLQSERFDPEGKYIKRFVPELARCTSKEIHCPDEKYITPIVNHAQQKTKALNLYKAYAKKT